jgi:hypothetical protein
MTAPDIQTLRMFAASLLPEHIHVFQHKMASGDVMNLFLWKPSWLPVTEREWLHVAWLVEQTLTRYECNKYNDLLIDGKPSRSIVVNEAEKWTWGQDAEHRLAAIWRVKNPTQ